MESDDVRKYVHRGWGPAEALKQEHWVREFARRGADATLEASEVLRQQMRCVRPDWPSDQERREDLAHHIALKVAIDRVAGAGVPLPPR